MPTNLYLKKQLSTNLPIVVQMHKRVGAYPEKKFGTQEPTGKMETLYIFIDAKGQELKHYAKEREEETLSLYQPGDKIQVVLQESMKNIDGVDKRISFLVWGTPGSAEVRAQPQLQPNTAVIRQEKNMEAYQDEQKVKGIAISLQGFMQQILPVLLKDGLDAETWSGKGKISDALNLAEKAYLALQERAHALSK